MKISIIACCILLCYVSTRAQVVSVSGIVLDSTQKTPLNGASVALLAKKDSTVLRGVYTDKSGRFVIPKVEKSENLVRISYAGMQTRYINPENYAVTTGNTVDIGEIILNTTTQQSVDVIAERKQIEYQGGTIVFNVDKSLTAAGQSILEMLKQVPGVNVDMDGNITVRGTAGVNIMIDNKPISAYGNVSQILQGAPAAIVQKVEIITNPNSKYDAEGTSGILNLVLKKQQEDGFNALVQGSTGLLDLYSGALSINNRVGGVNLFGGADFSSVRQRRLRFQETFFGETSTMLRTAVNNAKSQSQGARVGAEIQFDTLNSASLSVDFRKSVSNQFDPYTTRFTNRVDTNTVKSYLDMTQTGGGPYTALTVSGNFRHMFDRAGHMITFDSFLSPNWFDIGSQFTSISATENGTPIPGTNTGNLSQTVGKSLFLIQQSDYVLPINDSSKFEAGLKATTLFINSNFNFSSLNPTSGAFTFRPDVSNGAKHIDNVFAAYVNYSNKVGLLSLQLGLRGEQTTNHFESVQTPSQSFDRAFGNLFPTVGLSYVLSDITSLQLSYSKRIDRPDPTQLNPFLDKTDSLVWRTGNVRLMPQYSHVLELGTMHQFDHATLMIQSYVTHTLSVINQRFREQVAPGILQEKPYNFGEGFTYGVWSSANVDVIPELKLNMEAGTFYQQVTGSFGTQNFNSNGFGWYGKLTANAQLPFEIRGQFDFDYHAKEVIQQGYRFPYSMINLAINRQFFDQALTIGINWTDILNTVRYGGKVRGDSFATELLNSRDYTLVSLNVTYKINDYKQNRRPNAPNTVSGANSI